MIIVCHNNLKRFFPTFLLAETESIYVESGNQSGETSFNSSPWDLTNPNTLQQIISLANLRGFRFALVRSTEDVNGASSPWTLALVDVHAPKVNVNTARSPIIKKRRVKGFGLYNNGKCIIILTSVSNKQLWFQGLFA